MIFRFLAPVEFLSFHEREKRYALTERRAVKAKNDHSLSYANSSKDHIMFQENPK